MKIVIGADHAGVELKRALVEELRKDGYTVEDAGTHETTPVDYPDIARAVGHPVADGRAERGIIVCGSGVGACIAANKVKGIRAGMCHDTYSGHQGVEHDGMNILCLGGRVIGPALALEIARAFLAAQTSTEERHRRRIGKILEMERLQR
jgi:ribose 5-phosphate isomerase B